jgi:DNA-binding response OmpR family regulator
MPRILVVDDEPEIVRGLEDNLRFEGYQILTATNGADGLALAASQAPDLVILDIMMPKLSGWEVARELRRRGLDVPVIMLTARGEEVDRVLGLELGADDYVVKPFSPREVVARVRAVLRRSTQPGEPNDLIRIGDIVLDMPRMRITVGEAPIELTVTEFQLLATMARRPGRVFTRGQLLDAVRGIAFEGYERAIDAHIKNIRRKIEPDSAKPRYIQTVYGVGYRFAED